jgi:hypothetical protein
MAYEVSRMVAGTGLVTGRASRNSGAIQMVPAGLLGAAIEDGTAIGEGRRGPELPSMPRRGFGSFYVCGRGRADGRAEAGRRS